jgi:hypothetical protein
MYPMYVYVKTRFIYFFQLNLIRVFSLSLSLFFFTSRQQLKRNLAYLLIIYCNKDIFKSK